MAVLDSVRMDIKQLNKMLGLLVLDFRLTTKSGYKTIELDVQTNSSYELTFNSG